jgi:high-affinity Fe2+/Pb2+ permease
MVEFFETMFADTPTWLIIVDILSVLLLITWFVYAVIKKFRKKKPLKTVINSVRVTDPLDEVRAHDD